MDAVTKNLEKAVATRRLPNADEVAQVIAAKRVFEEIAAEVRKKPLREAST
jgi:hypothetical protein